MLVHRHSAKAQIANRMRIAASPLVDHSSPPVREKADASCPSSLGPFFQGQTPVSPWIDSGQRHTEISSHKIRGTRQQPIIRGASELKCFMRTSSPSTMERLQPRTSSFRVLRFRSIQYQKGLDPLTEQHQRAVFGHVEVIGLNRAVREFGLDPVLRYDGSFLDVY